MSRKRQPAGTGELPLPMTPPRTADDAQPVDPAKTTDAARQFTEAKPVTIADTFPIPTMSAPAILPATQLDRANALARAREEGEREGLIRGYAECIAKAYEVHEGGGDGDGSLAATAAREMLDELHRRYPDDARVAYHLHIRGLSP